MIKHQKREKNKNRKQRFYVCAVCVVRWFCHMDDDTYLNVVALVKLLRLYPHYEDWYIGKLSTSKPLTVTSRIRPHSQVCV